MTVEGIEHMLVLADDVERTRDFAHAMKRGRHE